MQQGPPSGFTLCAFNNRKGGNDVTPSVPLRAVPRAALSAAAIAGLIILSAVMAQSAKASTSTPAFHAIVEAEDASGAIGDVYDSRRIGDQPAGLAAALSRYSGSGFLDFSNPVASSDWRGTIPAGPHRAAGAIHGPRSGTFRLPVGFHNPP